MASIVVIDVNVLLNAITGNEICRVRMDTWHENGIQILAPSLFAYEYSSILAKEALQYSRDPETGLPPEEVDTLLNMYHQFPVDLIPPTLEDDRIALSWARQVQRRNTYDGYYLSLALRNQTLCFTCDKPFVKAAQNYGYDHVVNIMEYEQQL